MNLLGLYAQLNALRHVRRFARFHCASPIDVSQHSFNVMMLGHSLAQDLFRCLDVPASALRPLVVMYGCAWHDFPEAVTSDIPHDVKRASVEIHARIEAMEEQTLGRLHELAGFEPFVLTDLEGAIVKMADWFELILYAHSERMIGNPTIGLPAARIWHCLSGMLYEKFKALGYWEWYLKQLDDLRTATEPHSTTLMEYGR